MKVMVGTTFTMDASAVPPPHGLFFTATDDEEKVAMKRVVEEDNEQEENSLSSSSSSIGAAEDDSEEEEEDDAVSSKGIGSLGSLDSLEDSLPIKRGLSNYFSGKSKSFADLSEVTKTVAATGSVKEIEKAENPFNKRRRILLANRWASASRKSSFYAWQKNNPTSMPLLTLQEDDRESLDFNDDRHHHGLPDDRHHIASFSSSSSSSSITTERKLDDPEPEQDKWSHPPRFNQERRFKSTAGGSPSLSRSCFSLTDLQ